MVVASCFLFWRYCHRFYRQVMVTGKGNQAGSALGLSQKLEKLTDRIWNSSIFIVSKVYKYRTILGLWHHPLSFAFPWICCLWTPLHLRAACFRLVWEDAGEPEIRHPELRFPPCGDGQRKRGNGRRRLCGSGELEKGPPLRVQGHWVLHLCLHRCSPRWVPVRIWSGRFRSVFGERILRSFPTRFGVFYEDTVSFVLPSFIHASHQSSVVIQNIILVY